MSLANENYLKTPEIYCFDEIEKHVNAFKLLPTTFKIIPIAFPILFSVLPRHSILVKEMQKLMN
jgi:hypothetical protein